jgi:hypothetical protein
VSHLPLPDREGGGRYPGFDVMAQARHWDPATTAVVAERVGIPPDVRFFNRDEVVTATALCDALLHQRSDPRVPVVSLIDSRLAEQETDGWHYAWMPPDGEAWRRSLAALEEDALARHAHRFGQLTPEQQTELLRRIQQAEGEWRGLPAAAVWSLWTRYACTAFYSHPWAWEEIGYAGPAYPRGYKSVGPDGREPFEVADAHPATGAPDAGSSDR